MSCDRRVGSAAVPVALTMGASVIAMGRDLGKLRKLQEISGGGRLQVVQITNDHKQEMDALAQCEPFEAFFDVSPPRAAGSSHIRSGMLSLKHSGRVVLMGSGIGDVTVPVAVLMAKNLTIKGKWMFEPEDVRRMIQMVEAGILPLGSL
ncbi:NAD(P)-binding protein [Aspergillus udagawae]|nr:NAD(P)-binding protein [Aspergillus udagawae]